MKVLITGGSGFIGKHLVRNLLQKGGCKIAIIDDLSNSNLQAFYEFLSTNNNVSAQFKDDILTFHQVDIRDRRDVYEVFRNEGGVDVCVHLAARVNVADSLKDPETTFSTNVKGTENVLYSASETRTRDFVFASSAAVYGKSRRLPIAEGDSTEPISPMGESKLRGEKLIQEYAKKFRTVRSLRIFNVYGTGQPMEKAGVITRFADQILNGKPPIIYGDGTQTRDFISIDDVTRSIIMAAGINGQHRDSGRERRVLKRRGRNGYTKIENLFNVGTGIATTISELATLMIDLLVGHEQQSLLPIYVNRSDGDIENSLADTTRSRLILGFIFKDDLMSGLSRVFLGD